MPNTLNAADVPLETFGGWVTEMSPINLPAGVSPQCPECAFVPGSAFTRAAFKRVFFPPLEPSATITYGKSFKTTEGIIYNLYLSSTGNLYLENLTTSPGTATILYTTDPGSYLTSITAFDREYLAISDGHHGTDSPLQFDGTNLDRVTQDGPGTPPVVQSVALPSANLASSGNTLTRNNNFVTAVTATPIQLQVGYQVQIANVPDSNSTSVNQTNSGTNFVYNHAVWQFNNFQFPLYRSLFSGAGNSLLSDFTVSGFGFNVPATATILGVTINFGSFVQSASVATINQVALWLAGVQEGTAKTPATPLTTTLTPYSYGGSADLWGAALTPTIVNDPTFGFAVSCGFNSNRIFLDFPFQVTVYYTLSGSGTVATITSIVIENESHPGLALVTTSQPHGLIPEIYISLVGVQPATIGSVSAAQWVAGVTTLTFTTSHNLTPGAVIQTSSITTASGSTSFSFNGTFTVATVPSPNQITYEQAPIAAGDLDVINATASTGTATISWPIPDNTPTPTYFEVDSCPTSTTFYIAVNYTNGTWTTGTIGFIWEGTFFVTKVFSPTSFQYQQYGPNGATTAVGTATPFGQAAPGKHLCRQSFLTRQGYVTKPSPWVQFIANGGQYLQIGNLAIGPSNVIARILEFTGADGSLFYYLPTPSVVQGQVVSTATQINNNTDTTALLDFSDNSLFAGLGTSIPGNNTPAQIVLDSALKFRSVDTFLTTMGQRNTVTNLLNMGFAGGTILPFLPTGWTTTATGGAAFGMLPGRVGNALVVNNAGVSNIPISFSQPCYQDQNGAPILTGNTEYSWRCWLKGATGNETFTVTISSASTPFSTSVVFTNPSTSPIGGYQTLTFPVKTPVQIPSDMTLTISLEIFGAGQSIMVNENSLIFQDTPFTDSIINVSYSDNPEAFDGVTGKTGPSADPNQVMDLFVLDDIPYILTADPAGKLHEITNTGSTLPDQWGVNERGSNCGILGPFASALSEAGDQTASGGEQWAVWASESGLRIFGGSTPWKISQEIQPNWWAQGNTQVEINMEFRQTVWVMNDPVGRVVYIGVPINTATAPTAVYSMSYRELDSAEMIAFSPPFRTSYSGRLIATDNTRKWSPWYRTMNGAARMYRTPDNLEPVFFAGNGAYPHQVQGGFGNVYTLNPDFFTDDDFGQIFSAYFTSAMPSKDMEQALQLSSARKLLDYLTAYVSAVGNINIVVYPAALTNPWPLKCVRQPGLNPIFDLEWGGGSAEGQRFFFSVAPTPLTGMTDAYFNLQRFVPWFKKSARKPVRGAAV